jgi:serine/threonine-protein kinase
VLELPIVAAAYGGKMGRTLKVDDILAKYKSPRLLSDEGGQKIVFVVVHPKFGECVLKVGYYSSRSGLERIQREVAILRGISSEYFPRNFDFEVIDGERYLILEELLQGETLAKSMDKYSLEAAIALIAELVVALNILWAKRIVHRDVKPQNIIVTDKGARVIDLGIARLLDATSLTDTMAPFGPRTPYYASPEQIENRKRDIDCRSDQFNLGIILAQLILKGVHPFDPEIVRNDRSILENIQSGQWARGIIEKKVSSPLYALIDRLLGHEPYQRFRRADDLQAILAELRGG